MKISREQLSTICREFHKYFRVHDCKNAIDIDMFKAIDELDDIKILKDCMQRIAERMVVK